MTRFLYDADGGRVKQTVGTTTAWTTTILNAGGLFVQTGSTATKWYRLGGSPVAFRQGTVLHYLIDDRLSSTSLTYTPSTDASKKQLYYPFGDVRYTQTPATTRGFTGQRKDGSGLMFYQSRYYDPLIGRFTQPDTIIPNPSNPQDFNRYSYVLNNPILYSDPTGHLGWPMPRCDSACAARVDAWQSSFVEGFGERALQTLKVWEWVPEAITFGTDLTIELGAELVGVGDQSRDSLGYSPSKALVDSLVAQVGDLASGDPHAWGEAAFDMFLTAGTAGASAAAKGRFATRRLTTWLLRRVWLWISWRRRLVVGMRR